MPTPDQNLAGIFFQHGWWHPAGAGEARTGKYLRQARDSKAPIERLPKSRRRTCVQAGANVGAWPITLAQTFQRVVTFEPEEANWICLQRNLEAQASKVRARVHAHRAGLGAKPGRGHLVFNRNNAYAHKFRFDGEAALDVTPKFEEIEAGVEVMTIDQLELDDVDLICLDIEGAELPALKGGEQTVERCRPVILYEDIGHGRVHGYGSEDLQRWLRKRGYRYVGKCGRDRLWVP